MKFEMIINSLIILLLISSCLNDKYLEELKDFNLTERELDKFLFCSLLFQTKLDNEENKLKELKTILNGTAKDDIYEKISMEILEKCYEKVRFETTKKYFQNLTYIKEIEWSKEFDEYTYIDYTKYKEKNDLELTPNEEILANKYHKIMEIYSKKESDQEKFIEDESKKVRIGKVDLESVPTYIKLSLFLLVFGLLFGGSWWFLRSLNNKSKTKKKKKKTQ